MSDKLTAYAFGPTIFDTKGGSLDGFISHVREDIVEKIISGETRGLSPEIKIKWFQCGICKKNYENECDHEEGKFYDNEKCVLYPRDIEFLAISIVSVPEEPKARVTDLLIIDKKNKKVYYTWYGFATDKDDRRFKHIQKAIDSGLLPEKIGLTFSSYFTSNILGTITFS